MKIQTRLAAQNARPKAADAASYPAKRKMAMWKECRKESQHLVL
jgi:hypothetical protein